MLLMQRLLRPSAPQRPRLTRRVLLKRLMLRRSLGQPHLTLLRQTRLRIQEQVHRRLRRCRTLKLRDRRVSRFP